LKKKDGEEGGEERREESFVQTSLG